MALLGLIEFTEFRHLFEKKFSNFCSKCPLNLEFSVGNEKIYIFDRTLPDSPYQYIHNFDFSKSVSENIAEIKEVLSKRYPVISFKETVVENLSPQEKMELVKSGISIDDVVSKRKETMVVTSYRIDRRLDQSNDLILENLEDGVLSLWKLKTPISILVDLLFTNPDRASDMFRSKSIFIKNLDRSNGTS